MVGKPIHCKAIRFCLMVGKPVHRKDVNRHYEQRVQDRLILALVNQSVACLDDKVVADAELVDAGTIFGAGFAPFRGGPLRYLHDSGVEKLHAVLLELELSLGKRFTPSAGWKILMENSLPKS